MKNAIIYFYNMYVNDIRKLNNNYYFSFNDDDYVIEQYNFDIKESVFMYELNKEMLDNKINTYKIILTKENNVLFEYDGYLYFLMIIPKIRNRIITYDDVINFNVYTNNDKVLNALDKSNWAYYWSEKIDYIEYQFSSVMDKYKVIKNSINYYIGLWENAISYYNDNVNGSYVKQVVHKRVDTNMDLLSFLNPINLIIDTKERDLGEYFKSYIINESYTVDNINNMLNKISLDDVKVKRFICRIMFSSYYFDRYDDIMVGSSDESVLNDVINKNKNILVLLQIIFDKYKNSNIPQIQWIKKED